MSSRNREFALRRNVTAFDAVHVSLAEALDAPLVTRDRLASRARRDITRGSSLSEIVAP